MTVFGELWAKFWWLAALLAVIWAVQVLNMVTGYALNGWFGLVPRRLGGLDGIALMPLLHGSVAHAVSNTAPLAALGALVISSARPVALPATALIVGIGGLGVWLLGSAAIHVGASGLIFGWFGFLAARGVVERRPLPLLVAAAVLVLYGTMLWGVVPGQRGVSWEAHLFGALAGVAAAVLLRARA